MPTQDRRRSDWEHHLMMVAAVTLIMQQNPSSQNETVFPSGTGSA
jgi:hypothetical protein